jgi:hypothetical protein
VVDARFEVDDRRLEGVFRGEDEKEIEFTTLGMLMRLAEGKRRGTNSVRSTFGAIEDDVPVVHIGFVDEAHLDARWRSGSNLRKFLFLVSSLNLSHPTLPTHFGNTLLGHLAEFLLTLKLRPICVTTVFSIGNKLPITSKSASLLQEEVEEVVNQSRNRTCEVV